jgi:hypothetical protein
LRQNPVIAGFRRFANTAGTTIKRRFEDGATKSSLGYEVVPLFRTMRGASGCDGGACRLRPRRPADPFAIRDKQLGYEIRRNSAHDALTSAPTRGAIA